MNLFIDTISPKNILFLFNDEKEILFQKNIDVRLQESSKLIGEVDLFLKEAGKTYFDLKKIVVVNGPGSFTWVRTTVLMANTIAFVVKAEMFGISYFELFDEYPIIKASSKRDSFIQKNYNSSIEVLQNDSVNEYLEQNNISKIFWEATFLENVESMNEVSYVKVLQKISFNAPQSRIEPLYLKKPNIS